jgi:hypothetical protein
VLGEGASHELDRLEFGHPEKLEVAVVGYLPSAAYLFQYSLLSAFEFLLNLGEGD